MSHTAHSHESDPTASAAAPAVLDSKLVIDLLESLAEPNSVAALYRKFIGNAAVFIKDLPVQEHAARLDTLHTLRGSAGMMGAQRLAAVAGELQTQLQRASSSPIEPMAEMLDGELRALHAEASSQLTTLGATLQL